MFLLGELGPVFEESWMFTAQPWSILGLTRPDSSVVSSTVERG